PSRQPDEDHGIGSGGEGLFWLLFRPDIGTECECSSRQSAVSDKITSIQTHDLSSIFNQYTYWNCGDTSIAHRISAHSTAFASSPAKATVASDSCSVG